MDDDSPYVRIMKEQVEAFFRWDDHRKACRECRMGAYCDEGDALYYAWRGDD